MMRRPRRRHGDGFNHRVVAVVASLAFFLAVMAAAPVEAKRTERLADVPIAVAVIDSCELAPDLVNVAELLATTPLPPSVRGCIV